MLRCDNAQQLIDIDDAAELKIGIFYIDTLQAGTNTHTTDLFVPNDLEVGSDYMLVAVLDPAGSVTGEFVTEDNFSRSLLADIKFLLGHN
jgi:hypothetical protein